MQAKSNLKWAVLFLLTILTSFPVFVGIYFADPRNNDLFQGAGERAAGTESKKESRGLQGRVILLKGSSVTVDKTRLVYKGLHDRRILLEYCLLELDPESLYRKRISRAEARSGIRLGDSFFQLVSVNRNVLKFRMDGVYRTH